MRSEGRSPEPERAAGGARSGDWRARALARLLAIGPTSLYAVLALLVLGAAAMLLLGVHSRYAVSCTREPPALCILEQSRIAGARARRTLPSASLDSAVVRIVRPRRGSARVLLYMYFGREALFASEFESADAEAVARRHAASLNEFVARPLVRAVAFEERVPAFLLVGSWIGLAVAAALTVAGHQASRRATTTTPVRT